jgi:hypothetical protein
MGTMQFAFSLAKTNLLFLDNFRRVKVTNILYHSGIKFRGYGVPLLHPSKLPDQLQRGIPQSACPLYGRSLMMIR